MPVELANFREKVLVSPKERKIVISGEVNVDMEEALCKALFVFEQESNENIKLFFDSCGGRAQAGQHLFGLIRAMRVPVHGIVMTKACSAAFHILQACRWRVAFPESELMNHGTELAGLRIDQPDLETRLSHWRARHEDFLSFLASRSRVTLDQLRTWSIAEKYLTAPEALEAGLIDEIYSPT